MIKSNPISSGNQWRFNPIPYRNLHKRTNKLKFVTRLNIILSWLSLAEIIICNRVVLDQLYRARLTFSGFARNCTHTKPVRHGSSIDVDQVFDTYRNIGNSSTEPLFHISLWLHPPDEADLLVVTCDSWICRGDDREKRKWVASCYSCLFVSFNLFLRSSLDEVLNCLAEADVKQVKTQKICTSSLNPSIYEHNWRADHESRCIVHYIDKFLLQFSILLVYLQWNSSKEPNKQWNWR